MNDTPNTPETLDINDVIATLPEGATDIKIIEGNDTDGETNVIHVATDVTDVPVDTTVH